MMTRKGSTIALLVTLLFVGLVGLIFLVPRVRQTDGKTYAVVLRSSSETSRSHLPVNRFGYNNKEFFAEVMMPNGDVNWVALTGAEIYPADDTNMRASIAVDPKTGRAVSVIIPDGSQFTHIVIVGQADP